MVNMVNSHISLEDGNIFRTNHQTIVVTVNCVGVMGKGIALLAKHFSPDAYKYYRGLCEKDEMHMGEPVLYDKPSKTLQGPGKEYIKLLLFPTKQHWKMPGDIVSIEEKNEIDYLITGRASERMSCEQHKIVVYTCARLVFKSGL